MDNITEFTIYNCKRSKEQRSIAQLVRLNNKEVVIKFNKGFFAYCELREVMPMFMFKHIERIEDSTTIDLKDIKNITEGVFKVMFKNLYTMYLIIFKDLSAVVYLPDKDSVVFWKRAEDMLRHIIENSLQWIP